MQPKWIEVCRAFALQNPGTCSCGSNGWLDGGVHLASGYEVIAHCRTESCHDSLKGSVVKEQRAILEQVSFADDHRTF